MTKNDIKLGIVFLQHNRSDYTLRTLKSIGYNTECNYVIYIGDSKSDKYHSDALHNRIPINKSYFESGEYDIVNNYMFLDENKSIGKNKNVVIKSLLDSYNVEYLLICDNDMDFTKGWYEKAVELFNRSGADLLGLWRHPHHNSVKPVCEGVDEMNNVPGNCWLTTPDIFDKAGGYLAELTIKESLEVKGEDTEFIFRMHDMGLKAYSVTENLMTHFGEIRSDGKKALGFE